MKRMVGSNLRIGCVQRIDTFMHSWSDFADLGEVCLGENQVMRMNVTCIHEHSRLLSAMARVRLVHKSAPVVHEVMQVAPCPRQLLPEVLSSDTHTLSALRIQCWGEPRNQRI